jgi:hypothetical protein
MVQQATMYQSILTIKGWILSVLVALFFVLIASYLGHPYGAGILVVIVASFWIVLLKPSLWLYSIVAIMPFFLQRSDTTVSTFEIFVVAYIIGGLCLWMLYKLLLNPTSIIRTWFDMLMLVYLAFSVVNVVYAIGNGTDVLSWGREWGLNIIIFLYLPIREYLYEERDLKRFLTLCALIASVLVFKNLYYFKSNAAAATLAYQLGGIRDNPPVFLFGTLLGIIWLVYSQNLKAKLILSGFTVIQMVGLLVTYARTTWVATIIGIILMLFYFNKHQLRRIVLYLIILVSGIVGMVPLVLGNKLSSVFTTVITKRFTSTSKGIKDISFSARLYEIKALEKLIEEQPLGGYGCGTTFKHYDPIGKVNAEKPYIHNGIYSHLYKLGLPLSVYFYGVYILQCITCLYMGWHTRSSLQRTLLIGGGVTLCVLLIESFSATIFYYRTGVIVLAVVLGLCEIAKLKYLNDVRNFKTA